MVEKLCRCGKKTREVQCFKEYLCETRCTKMRDCRKHPCRRKVSLWSLRTFPCIQSCSEILNLNYKSPNGLHYVFSVAMETAQPASSAVERVWAVEITSAQACAIEVGCVFFALLNSLLQYCDPAFSRIRSYISHTILHPFNPCRTMLPMPTHSLNKLSMRSHHYHGALWTWKGHTTSQM